MATGSFRRERAAALPGLPAIYRLALRTRRPAYVRLPEAGQAQPVCRINRRARFLSLRLRFLADREFCHDSGVYMASATTPLRAPPDFRRRPPCLAGSCRGDARVVAGGTPADYRLLLVFGHRLLAVSLLLPAPRAGCGLEASGPAGGGKGCAKIGRNIRPRVWLGRRHGSSWGGEQAKHGTTAPVI